MNDFKLKWKLNEKTHVYLFNTSRNFEMKTISSGIHIVKY